GPCARARARGRREAQTRVGLVAPRGARASDTPSRAPRPRRPPRAALRRPRPAALPARRPAPPPRSPAPRGAGPGPVAGAGARPRRVARTERATLRGRKPGSRGTARAADPRSPRSARRRRAAPLSCSSLPRRQYNGLFVVAAIVIPAKKQIAPTPTARSGRRESRGAMPVAISARRIANGLTLSGSQKSARTLPAIEITARKP